MNFAQNQKTLLFSIHELKKKAKIKKMSQITPVFFLQN